MSITRDNFDRDRFKPRRHEGDDKDHPIVIFLRRHATRAYTTAEINRHVKTTLWGTRSALRRLKQKGLITHKSPYYAIAQSKKRKRR